MDPDRDSLRLARLVAGGERDALGALIAASPELAVRRLEVGATRGNAADFFLAEIAHYVVSGDTLLHVAAAAFRRSVAELLLGHGADPRARNRRGAEPLHYAADTNRRDPVAQVETIELLLTWGADPNVRDRSGVTPLHRAVRTRSAAAVLALLDGGADPSAPNGAGRTPLQIASSSSGRSGSGSAESRREQAAILAVFCERERTDNRASDAHAARMV